jgi:anti-sigma factor RsiW
VNQVPAADLDRAHVLMMAALDGECSPAERQELDGLLTRHAELAAEWERLRRVREVMADMSLRRPPEEVWDRFRISVLHRAERSLAWLLITAGAAVLGAWALWEWLGRVLSDADLPRPIRLAIVAIAAGAVILLVSVIRERWFLHRRDPYSREVIR